MARIKNRLPTPPRVKRHSALMLSRTVETSYMAFMRSIMRELRAIIFSELTSSILAEGLRTDSILPSKIHLAFGKVELRFAELFERDGKIAKRAYATGLNIENLTNNQFQKLVGEMVIKPDPTKVFEFVERNTNLIESLGAKEVAKTKTLVEQGILKGRSVRDLEQELIHQFDVTKSKANLIARDQILKFHGDLVQDKQIKAGITRYIWTTSNDERVREIHAELEGTEHKWDTPPIISIDGRRGHPGDDYQCRCIAYPVVEWLPEEDFGLTDLQSNVAAFADYRKVA